MAGSEGVQQLARAAELPKHPAVVERRGKRADRQRHCHGLELKLVAHVQRVALVQPHGLRRATAQFANMVPQTGWFACLLIRSCGHAIKAFTKAGSDKAVAVLG